MCNAEKTSTVKLTSAQKKSRVSLKDSSSEESDDRQALGVNTGKLPGEDHNNCPTGYESDIVMEQSPDVVVGHTKMLSTCHTIRPFQVVRNSNSSSSSNSPSPVKTKASNA